MRSELRIERLRPRTLTARLVVTAVVLVAVVSLLIAAIATVAIRTSLMQRLDADVLSSVQRVGDGDRDQGRRSPRPITTNQGPGTLIAAVTPGTSSSTATKNSSGVVLTEESGGQRQLSGEALHELAEVPVDGRVHAVRLS
ncbi:MAG: hypothetical protein ABIN79_06100, partial [Marmoricola sp.]